MGVIDDMIDRMIRDRQHDDSRVVHCQTKLTRPQSDLFDEYVDYWRGHGVPNMTRSSAMRSLLLEALENFTHHRQLETAIRETP